MNEQKTKSLKETRGSKVQRNNRQELKPKPEAERTRRRSRRDKP